MNTHNYSFESKNLLDEQPITPCSGVTQIYKKVPLTNQQSKNRKRNKLAKQSRKNNH